MRHEVFVYGSLKAGFWNNAIMQRGGAKLVGQACTASFMVLVDGPFPYMASPQQFGPDAYKVATEFGGNVYGEVWSVDDETLKELDRLEGTPRHYTREVITVQFSPGNQRPVFGYRVANVALLVGADFIKPDEVTSALSWPTGDTRKRFA